MPAVIAPSLEGKIALVTGASRGIGQRFASAGATVVVTARSLETSKSEPETLRESVDLIAPSTAIATPGASRYIPSGYPTEPVEYLAACALQRAYLPAAERTGLVTHSMHFPAALGFKVYRLDGRSELPPALAPAGSHPGIVPSGEWR